MPQKHILISYGRSGSSFINMNLANILNLKYHTQIGIELMGSNTQQMKQVKKSG